MDFLLRRWALAVSRRAGYLTLFTLPILVASCSGANTTSLFGCACPAVEDPVCGSDGVTYENGCNAECAGAKIAEVGYCASDGGVCSCPATSDPVCGGNGVTYENACDATCARQAIAHAGVCSTALDAGTGSDGAASPGSCSSLSCGPSQLCVDDGCSVSTCGEAGDGGTCPVGFAYQPNGLCGPGGIRSVGICTRACPASSHHCVDAPPSCSPVSCSCLPYDVCLPAGGQCGFVSNGVVNCVFAGPAGSL